MVRQNHEREIRNSADYNVILIGDSYVGKTSLINAYVYKRFEEDNIAVTI